MTVELTRITDGAECPLPPLLRVGFVVVASCCIAYLILFMFGEMGQAGYAANQAALYFIGSLAAAFFVGVSVFAAQGPQDESLVTRYTRPSE